MAVLIAPGVYTTVRDFSLFVPALSTSIFAVVGTASKGPKNTPTLITDEGTLVSVFGEPSATHLALHAAITYLRAGRVLYYVRVATSDATATGFLVDGITNVVDVDAVSSGSWGNNISLTIEAGTTVGTFKITVKFNGEPFEVFDNILVGSGNSASANFIDTRINGISQFIIATNLAVNTTLTSIALTLAGGLDGAPASEAAVIGTVVGTVKTGLQSLRNPDDLDINFVAIPGRWQKNIVAAIQTFCESARKDCMGIIDTPPSLSPADAVKWHNGTLTGNPDYLTTALSSSFLAVYWPWLQIFDQYNEVNIFVPPSGHAAFAWATNDREAEVWFAPAGPNRGILNNVLDVQYNAEEGDRIVFHQFPNCVNPIIKRPRTGIMLFDQLTCYRQSTSLRDINVRRMLLFLQKTIASATQFLLFDPNDSETQRRFVTLVDPHLDAVKTRRGLFDYRIICDETTNPPLQVDQGILKGRLLLKPTRAASIIEVEFDLLATGASFEEFS
jgi:hypothetical protein